MSISKRKRRCCCSSYTFKPYFFYIKLLTSYKDYDLGILPEDKASKLVFYCSNLQCSAAGKGAKRAVVAGYTDVNLMPQGIMGWADSGKDVKKL